jgi:mannose-6-phosphate isomerase-like protein (cupin superfamily)
MKTRFSEPRALGVEAALTDVWWPATGGRYTTKIAPEQTDGRLTQVLVTEPRGAAPPIHIHHDADETWYVIEGNVTIFVGDGQVETGPGDFAFGPRGVPHTFLVRSERAVMLVSFAPAGMEGPAGSGVDGFFKELGTPVVPGVGTPQMIMPAAEHFAERAAAYGIEVVGPPPTLD